MYIGRITLPLSQFMVFPFHVLCRPQTVYSLDFEIAHVTNYT